MEGYYTGVLDIYYALITKPETATTKPVYAAPAVMGKTIEVTITPNYKEGSVYASNVATRNEKRVDSYTVSVNVDKLPYAVRKALLGRTQDRARARRRTARACRLSRAARKRRKWPSASP